MGGGDLNLKKSWHPSTMKNMEKVRKAEQQNDQETKRIAELKKEIEMEKDLEDIKKYAVKQGVIEKKDDNKLDWMYKGPNQMVNREEYLLGRPVDKAFEQMKQTEKDTENRMPKNHVEYECIPPSLRFFSGNEQVDLARKIQEDPLYAIKKKEMETRNQLLKNPIKLKKLKELLEQQSSKNKSKKKKKKLKQDSSEDEAKLDILLVTKYKQLKDNISEKDLLKSMKKIKNKQTKKSKKYYHGSDSEANSSNDDHSVKKKRRKKRNRSISDSDNDSTDSNSSKSITKCEKKDNEKEHGKRYLKNDTEIEDKKYVRKRKLSEDRNPKYERSKKHREEYDTNSKRYDDDKQRDGSKNKYSDKKRIEKQNTDRNEEKYRLKARSSLTEREKEQRRKEMMANAVWRDKEREKNVKIYREQEKKEEHNNPYNKDFIRKQLVIATEVGTIASRIKANINNIQRSGRAMDTNFAKR